MGLLLAGRFFTGPATREKIRGGDIGEVLFEIYWNELAELCRIKRKKRIFSSVCVGTEVCFHGHLREGPFLQEGSMITYIAPLAWLHELRSKVCIESAERN